MKKKPGFFYQLSFYNKLLFIFLPLVSLFIIITGWSCLYFSGEQLKINSQIMMENSVQQTKTLMDDKLQQIYMKSISLINSSTYQYFIYSGKQDDRISREELANRNKLYQQMTDFAIDHWEIIDSLVLLEKTGDKMVYMRSPAPYVMKDTYETMLGKLPQGERSQSGQLSYFIWENEHEDKLLATRIPRRVLTLYNVAGNEDSTAGGILIINLRADYITDILENIAANQGSFAALLSEDSACVFESEDNAWSISAEELSHLTAEPQKGSYITQDSLGRSIMLSYEPLSVNGWMIVNGVPVKSIMTGTELMKKMIVLLVAIMLLIAIIPLTILSRWLSRDIAGLAGQIEDYQIGSQAAGFQTKDQKELKQIADALNQLVDTIQRQMEEKIEIERRKRRAELGLLQSQINPHFLYNTLISIKTLIDLKRYQMASNMFQSLIDFYVNSLNHGKERIPLKKEIEIIRNYLSILSVRYNNSFEWVINVDEEILDCEILTLTLQPLVENSVHHGLKNKDSHGVIDISGCALGETVILSVWDNGQGISSDQLDELRGDLKRKEIPENEESRHFGLWSSSQRLKLYFGEEYGIEIDSEYGNYTNVTVTIPNHKYGGGHEAADCG
ncbi:MAG: sensor histidine kinase [Clostridiales bacterium]|nr:sensor histidine kinase [Clostridiales bacterium]